MTLPIRTPRRTAVWAHRGARADAPENTLAAFSTARAQGADGVELDVRRSADAALVVHHDPEVPGVGLLVRVELAALRSRAPHVPTLAEALDVCAGMLVNVEVKNLPTEPDYDPDDDVATRVVGLLNARSRRDDVLVSSFNPITVERVHALDSSIQTGLLTYGIDPMVALGRAEADGHHAVHPQVGSLAGDRAADLVRAAHGAGLEVNVWTVNDPLEVVRLARAGVDAVITDVPAVARRALHPGGA